VPRVTVLLLTCAVALLVPGILVVNGIRLLANDWYVEAVYDNGGIPDDPHGLTGAQRDDLALTGLRSILPQHDEGVGLLREARLPGGDPAFDARELRHMQDVRDIVGGLYIGHLAALGAIALLAFALARTGARALVPKGLRAGAVLTLGIAAFAGLLLLIEADWFSTGFHTLFFEGESWRFDEADTLRRLYPERFWTITSAILTAAAIVQALVLLAVAHFWLRGRRPSLGAELPSRARTGS